MFQYKIWEITHSTSKIIYDMKHLVLLKSPTPLHPTLYWNQESGGIVDEPKKIWSKALKKFFVGIK